MVRQETKRQERGKRRIELILDAAAHVFADVGYEAATTNSIAARADISPGSLYQFFPNKEAIAEALAARYVAELEAMHDVALDPSLADLPLEEMLDRVVDPMVAFNLANPASKALLNAADLSPQLAQSTAHLHEAMCERVELLIASRAASLKPKERARAAQVTIQIFKALLPMVMSAGRADRAPVISELKSALRGYLESIERG